MNVPLRIRVAGLVLGLMLAFTAIGLSLDFGHRNQKFLILQQEHEDSRRQLESTLTLLARTLTAYAQDYSYWDETVEFLRTRDPVWEESNLAQSFENYHADADWVFTSKFELCHAESRVPGAVLHQPPIDPKVLAKALLANPNLHCFARCRAGLLEIQAAPIQRQSPNGRVTPIEGYFLGARLWDEEMFADLSASLDAQVGLVPPGSKSTDLSSDGQQDRIEVRYPLHDASGRVLVEVRGARSVPFATELTEVARRTRMTLAMVVPAMLFFFFAAFWWWVNRPLDELTESVRERDSLRITEWARRDDEFGNLAREIVVILDSAGGSQGPDAKADKGRRRVA